MKIITKTQYLLLALLTGLLALNAAMAMQPMSDEEMGAVSGQALLMMDMREGVQGQSENYNFYRAGLDAVVELNANFEKLQLGCGGVNGPGCDIDIDHLSLTGQLNPDGTCSNGGGPRAACDAILTRPFFEFAIKNDHTPHREIVGFRLSAENSKGMLTAGDQQPGSQDPGNTGGINVMSGYMKLGPTTGVASTDPRPMAYADYTCSSSDPCDGFYPGLGRRLTGRIFTDAFLVRGIYDVKSEGYEMQLSAADAHVSVPSTIVSGKRLTQVDLLGSASIGQINFGGEMKANVNLLGGIALEKSVTGSITGLEAEVPIEQSLKFIHKINVDSAFSLSMQSENVWWPEAAVSSETGWWMAFEDEIDIGQVTPEDTVPIPNDVLLDAIGPENISWTPERPRSPNHDNYNGPQPPTSGEHVQCIQGPSINCALHTYLTGRNDRTGGGATGGSGNNYYEVYGIYCDGLGDCLGGGLNVGNLHVPAQLEFPLEHLKLSGQNVTPNCYGDARFC